MVHTSWHHEELLNTGTKVHHITDIILFFFLDTQQEHTLKQQKKKQSGFKKYTGEIKMPQMDGSQLYSLKSKTELNCYKCPALVEQRKYNFTTISKGRQRL